MIDGNIQLRNTLGILGFLLPILDATFNIIFGGSFNPPHVLASISATHYSSSYILFEGLVFGVGLFLICYRGYDITDWWLSTLSGCGAIILVLFPCKLEGAEVRNFLMLPMHITNIFHLAGAFIFFACLIIIIGWQFTKSVGITTRKKLSRNLLYVSCSVLMAIFLGFGFSMSAIAPEFPYWTYIGETGALWAFAAAWLTKGGLFLKD